MDSDDPRAALESRTVRPVVRLPQAGLSGAGIAILCAVLGIGLFLVLDSNRRSKESAGAGDDRTQPAIASPQPLVVPAAPLPPPPGRATKPPLPSSLTATAPQQVNAPPAQPMIPPYPIPMMQSEEPMPALPQQHDATDDKSSPLIIDLASSELSGNATAISGEAGDDQAVKARVIRNRSNLVPQGAMISAVLETPIDSRRPGLVRAVVSRDARGFDGTRVLIPRGSRLIGEATGDMMPGQKRVLVTWTRLIRPDGVAIRIGSPAADVLGGAGIAGRVNTHFFERFSNAVLQSALTIGVNVASRPKSGSVIVGVPGQLGATGQNLLPNVDQGPTIKVAAGADISVFVAKDLDFSGTGLRR